MKLKTLKDIRKVIPVIARVGDNMIYDDFVENEKGEITFVKDLKQSAIEDIKLLQKEIGSMKLQTMEFNWSNSKIKFSGDYWREAIEEYIKWKFNLSEEDLK